MAEAQYTDMPDSQKQQIKDRVVPIQEYMTPTANSYKNSTRTVTGGMQGFQIALWLSQYGQNSYLKPGPTGNSFVQPIPPQSGSMYVGLAYPGKVIYTDGIFSDTMDTRASMINDSQLRQLAIENYFKHMNYYAVGDDFGYGILAVVSSVTGGVFTGTTAAQLTSGYTKGAHRLLKGVTYDVVDETSFAVVGTITPTANGTNSATVTVTTTGSPNNAGAFVVEQGAFYAVPRGTNYLINNKDRIFQGIDTTDYVELNSSAIDLNGSAITSATLNTLKAKVNIRTNDGSGKKLGARIGHTTPGQYNTLAIQGYGARQYQSSEGQSDTSYGEPYKYEELGGDIMWYVDADYDEDRLMLRRSSDYFKFSLKAFGTVDKDGLTLRQAPGDNSVGAYAWYEQVREFYNFGFDGDGDNGNYASAFVQRAQTVNTQVNAAS